MLSTSRKMAAKRKTSDENGTNNAVGLISDDAANKKIKLKKDFHKVAKVEEINQLIASEKMYHSNFFHLQTEELLKTIKLSEKRLNFIESFSSAITDFLTALPSEEKETPVHELKWLKKNRVVPPIDDNLLFDSTPIKFQFISPASVFPIGSFRSKTVINADPVLDMCVDIPNDFFSKGNHLNGIYHRKKALYLSFLASKLSKWDQISECKFSYAHGNLFQPILMLRPAGKYGKHIVFSLRAVCSEESFKIERLSPEKSNVKQLKVVSESDSKIVKNEEHSATPHYNSSILGDLNTKFNDTNISNIIGDNQHIRDAILLLKIWCKQREFDLGPFGFNGFIISMFVTYLIQKNLITPSMNSYQIIRQVWIHLANTSWEQVGKSISIYDSKFRTTQPDLEVFHQYFDVVFVDPTGYYNICANLSLDVYCRVKSDSALALKLLNNEQVNSFRFLFATKIPLYTQVDHIVRFEVKDILEEITNREDFFDFAGYWYPYAEKSMFKILRSGLDQRIHAILPISELHQGKSLSWNIHEAHKSSGKQFKFGLVLNTEFALDILNKGPQSNLPEAEVYRQFWGPKSELRRFQDGSIAEACVWGSLTSSLAEKRLVCKQIVEHLLNHHFKIDQKNINYTAAQLDKAFAIDDIFNDFMEGGTNSENLSVQVIKTFDELAKDLRSLDELPLAITSILGQSPVFRNCELLPIIANARLFTKENKETFNAHIVNQVVIQFETSGKWPNDLGAIERVKAAFCLQIAQGLRKKFHLRSKVNVDSVDVIKGGFMYRLKIAVPREIALHMKEVTSKGVTKYRDSVKSKKMERELILLPKISVALHALYHQFSSFGPTVLLAKRWLYSQLIDSHLFDETCTELLVAHQYHNSGAIEPALQPQTAFIRFLYTMANTNWNTELFLLNFNNDLNRTYIEKLEMNFISKRDTFPPLCLITSNGENDKHTIWSEKSPSVEILARVTLLAKHAIKLIESMIFNDFIAENLFSASLDGYDLIINLNKQHLRDAIIYNFNRPPNFVCRQRKPFIPMSDYSPIESYLHELRSAYSHVAVFFYNPCAGEQIAVLWKPTSFAKQEFKLSAIQGQVTASDDQLQFDHKQLQSDFLILGQGLVANIIDNRANTKQ